MQSYTLCTIYHNEIMGGWPDKGNPYFARGGHTAIDNDQVLMKKWTVKEQKETESL